MRNTKQVMGAVISGVLLTLAATSVWSADSSVGTKLDDTVITTKVKSALIENPQTKARQINVETHAGTVQLNGFVDSLDAKKAAESVALSTAGVTKVDNNLQIRSAERTAGNTIDDTAVTAKIKAALVNDSRTKAHEINVRTNMGVVSLGGFVNSADEKQAAEVLAQGVPGVVSVQNGIMVSGR